MGLRPGRKYILFIMEGGGGGGVGGEGGDGGVGGCVAVDG